jgi:TorA maturation chaperone TorD
MESPTGLSEEAAARAAMYGFLSAVYLQPPTRELIQSLQGDPVAEELASVFSTQTVSQLARCDDATLPQLKQEYMDLFAVPAGRYVTPFEDVYRGIRQDGQQEGGLLLGERAIAAKVMYASAGAEMDSGCTELPTHIGVELSFMAFLCEREAVAYDQQDTPYATDDEFESPSEADIYRQYQLLFLQQHLNDWFPQLNCSIQAKATTRFYRGLAQLTEEFIASDLAAFMPLSQRVAVSQGHASAQQPGQATYGR